MVLLNLSEVPNAVLQRINLQRELGHTTWDVVSTFPDQICIPIPPTFLIPSGFRCRAASFSGLTTGILAVKLHIMFSGKPGYNSNRKRAKISKEPCCSL